MLFRTQDFIQLFDWIEEAILIFNVNHQSTIDIREYKDVVIIVAIPFLYGIAGFAE